MSSMKVKPRLTLNQMIREKIDQHQLNQVFRPERHAMFDQNASAPFNLGDTTITISLEMGSEN